MTDERVFVLHIEGTFLLEPRLYFDDSDVNEHPDATPEQCAEEARIWIRENGIVAFLRDWCVDDLDVTVENVPVAQAGRAVTA